MRKLSYFLQMPIPFPSPIDRYSMVAIIRGHIEARPDSKWGDVIVPDNEMYIRYPGEPPLKWYAEISDEFGKEHIHKWDNWTDESFVRLIELAGFDYDKLRNGGYDREPATRNEGGMKEFTQINQYPDLKETITSMYKKIKSMWWYDCPIFIYIPEVLSDLFGKEMIIDGDVIAIKIDASMVEIDLGNGEYKSDIFMGNKETHEN